jgi:hypothetical protein
MVINRVSPLSVAKLAGLLYAVLGLIFGAIISIIALAGGMGVNADEPDAAFPSLIFGAGAVIVLPILYGCMGFVMTLLMAALYNVSARIVGGVQIDVS